MQTPTPLGGGIWQKWIIPIPDNEFNAIVPQLQSYGSDWDLAYTEKQTNSASAFVTAGKKDNKMYIDEEFIINSFFFFFFKKFIYLL